MIDLALSEPDLPGKKAFQNAIEFDLVEVLTDEIADGRDGESRPMAKVRNRALRKALEVIGDSANEVMAVADVERLSGAGSRTLRYAFLEQFGVPPKQYLQAYRLNHVRRRLLQEPAAHGKVSDVANEWGFWHMGEFALQYRRLFGELPSTTLARRR